MTHISEPRKPMRRPHHKARTGCRNCKARRVKCNEQRPNCGGCTKGGVVCRYFDTICSFNPELKGQTRTLPPRKNVHQKEYPVSVTAPTANLREVTPPRPNQNIQSTLLVDVTLPIPIGTPTDRLLEVRLFHHYCTMSNQRPRRQGIWSNWIVTISLQNPSVMDALLGFSAFHIRRHSDTDSAIREVSHKYMARAIQSHYEQVQSGVNEYNAAALSASCALILFHTMTNQPYLSLGPGFQLPLHWFSPLKNASNFLAVASPWIQDTGMGNELEGVLKLEPQISPDTPHTFSFLLEGLTPHDEGVFSDYKQAITHLAYIHSSPNYQTLLRFPALVSSRFVHLLEAKDSRALAIVGYFFMLMKLAPLPWWLEGVAERDFDAIMAFLPIKWWPTMQWAIQEFNWSANRL